MKIFVYIDHFKGEIQPASWEAIGLGKSLGTVSAVVFGSGVDAVAKAAFENGADEVFVANSLFGIWPVREIDGRRFAVGPTTKRLMTHFEDGHA